VLRVQVFHSFEHYMLTREPASSAQRTQALREAWNAASARVGVQIAALHAAHEAYEKLLVEEIEEIIGIAAAHGWKSTRFEAGKEARERIAHALMIGDH
jgi:hypothetical protein